MVFELGLRSIFINTPKLSLLLDFEDSLSMYSIKEKHIHNVLNGRSPLLLYLNIFRNKNNQGQLVHLTSTTPSFEIN